MPNYPRGVLEDRITLLLSLCLHLPLKSFSLLGVMHSTPPNTPQRARNESRQRERENCILDSPTHHRTPHAINQTRLPALRAAQQATGDVFGGGPIQEHARQHLTADTQHLLQDRLALLQAPALAPPLNSPHYQQALPLRRPMTDEERADALRRIQDLTRMQTFRPLPYRPRNNAAAGPSHAPPLNHLQEQQTIAGPSHALLNPQEQVPQPRMTEEERLAMQRRIQELNQPVAFQPLPFRPDENPPENQGPENGAAAVNQQLENNNNQPPDDPGPQIPDFNILGNRNQARYFTPVIEATVQRISLGSMNLMCKLLLALSLNCSMEQVITHLTSKKKIRAYNAAFALASLGVTIDNSVLDGGGPYVFKIQGALYHRLGSLLPEAGQAPTYAQLYFYSSADANAARMRCNQAGRNNLGGLNAEVMGILDEVLLANHRYVQMFKTAERLSEQAAAHPDLASEIYTVIRCEQGTDAHRYNEPTAEEVAVILPGDGSVVTDYRDLIVHYRTGPVGLKRIYETHASYQPMVYVLLFPYGENGWHPRIPLNLPENPDADINEEEEDRDVGRTFIHGLQLIKAD
ncbi:hypothetical protein C8R45DRAFT_942676 [Mycena sanguinolenta]|nr:hypothetical protein C8R45DRAFT_942676 [Mycena sanguinolenta]